MKLPLRRTAIGACLGLVAIAIVGWLVWHRPHHADRVAAGLGVGSGSGGPALRAPPSPHLPGARGSQLTGFVVDGAGLPVVGADISAEIEQGTASLEHGASATDGRFAIEGLVPGRYRLRVTGHGLLAAEVRFVPVPSDEARIVVAREIAIVGTVTDGGKPVANANVGLRGDAIGGALEVKTDNTGAFSVPNLPEGRYQIYAWQAALAARTIRVSRLGAGPFAPVELRLEAGAIVVGRVIDRSEGTGLVAAIELRPSGDDQAPRYARSSEDGVFRIEGVPNGRWIADAYAPGYQSPGGVELDAGKGVPELALVRGAIMEGKVIDGVGKPIAGATVRAITSGANPTEASAEVDADRLRRFSGRTAAPVLDSALAMGRDPQLIPRGELGVMVGPIPPLPPPGGQIARASSIVDPTAASAGLVREPPPIASDPARASIWTTGSDGRYRITGLATGKVSVLAVATGFAEGRSKAVTVSVGEVTQHIDVILTAGTFIVGKVSDQHGQPVIGVEVSAQPEVGSPAVNFTDADGLYKIGPVSGQIELRASAYGHVEVRRTITLPPSKTVVDEHREDITLEVADATLVGTVADASGLPIGSAQLEVLVGSHGDASRRGVSNQDGTFALDMLPRGHLRVRVTQPDYPAVVLDAVASSTGERVRLVVPLGGAVEGALLDGSRGVPLAGVTLTAKGPGNATVEASTSTSGRWKLGPLEKGHWKLEVKLPGYLPFAQELDVPAATRAGTTTVRDVRIDLARGALVGGTVRDSRGQRVANAHVTVKAAASTAEGDADGRGEFRIHDAPTGEVDIEASKGNATGSTRVTVRAGDEVLGLAVELR
jgi:hypothetical protein